MTALLTVSLFLIAATNPVLAYEDAMIAILLGSAETDFKSGTFDRGCTALRLAKMFSSHPNIYGEASEKQKAQIQHYDLQYGSICQAKK